MKKHIFTLTVILTIAFESYGQTVTEILRSSVNYDSIKIEVDNVLQNKTTFTAQDSADIKTYARWNQFWGTRLTTNGKTGYTDAPESNFVTCGSLGNWEALGPFEFPGKFRPLAINNGVGRITSIAVYEQNHDIIYIGSNTGGIFKSTDLGASWQSAFDIDSIRVPGLGVLDIIIHPNNPDIVYIATGLYGPWHDWGGKAYYGAGIYKTEDGGVTWNNISQGFDTGYKFATVNNIAFSPTNPNEVFATYEDKIMHSTNAGNSFTVYRTNPNGQNFEKLKLIDSGSDKLLYATTIGSQPQIWRCKRNTSNWTDITSSNMTGERLFIDVTPAAPNSLYVEYAPYKINNNTYPGKLFISNNRGGNYNIKNTSIPGQNETKNDIAVSPTDTNVMFMGGLKTWRSFNAADYFAAQFYNHHSDVRVITYISGGALGTNGAQDSLLVGHDGGIHLIVGLSMYNLSNSNLNNSQSWDCAVPDFAKNYAVIGAQDNGTTILKDGSWLKVSGGDGGTNIFTNYNGTDYFISSLNENLNIFNVVTGSERNIINDLCSQFNYGDLCYGVATHTRPFLINTQKPNIFYYGLYNLFKLDLSAPNIGNTETNISSTLDLRFLKIQALAMSETDSNVIYAGIGFSQWTNGATAPLIDSSLFKTTNGGTTWNAISPPWAARSGGGITSIVVNPSNHNELWVTYGGFYNNEAGNSESDPSLNDKVFHSTNGGISWANYSQGLMNFPVNEIIYEKGSNNRLYIATDIGVFYRDNTMSEWECFNSGLPSVITTGLSINYCTRKLYTSTFGRGLWSAGLLPSTPDLIGSVGSNTVWTTDKNIIQDIRLAAGSILTINNATINMAAGTKIIVDQGAELILNGATITNACGDFWSGIEVWGTSPNSFSTQFCTQQSGCPVGKLTMVNSTLENADQAVRLWKPGNWNMRGGMIYAHNSTFKNNRKAVEFVAFENHYNTGANNGNIAPYQSIFNNCDFEIDSNYFFDVQAPRNVMVSMWQVRGIKFNGCEFKNTSGQQLNVDGIFSYDANYTVKENCMFYPCTATLSRFEGLRSGITAMSSGLAYNFVVDTAVFNNNHFGVIAVGVDQAVITRNLFTYFDNTTSQNPTGIILDNADQFRVEENVMKNYSERPFTGIFTKSSGGDNNFIYKNAFENMLRANIAYHDNNNSNFDWIGLQYRCNLSVNTGNKDLEIFGGTGIAKNQGADTLAADNTFTQGNASTYNPYTHITNAGNSTLINYYYHTNANGYVFEPTDINTYDVNTINIADPFSPNNNCLSELTYFIEKERGRMPSGKRVETRDRFDDTQAAYYQTHYVYVSTIDGGDTYGLLNTVQNTNAQQAWDLRNDLIAASPLSLEVIHNTIDEDILSNALLLDVLMVNPHAAREEEIISKLETKTTPMPAYMINTFLGIFEVQTQKDLLEAKMGIELQEINQTARMLIGHWYADTTGADLDSIPPLLTQINIPHADMYKVAFYLGTENTEAAGLLLDSIPTKYELTDAEAVLVTGVSNFYTTRNAAALQGDSALFNISETARNSVLLIANDSLTKAGKYAKAWLTFADEELYWPYLPENVVANKKEERNVFEKREVEKNAFLLVYPNPASDFITIERKEVGNTNLTIQIINSSGNTVISKTLSKSGAFNISTVHLSSGVYVLRVLDGAQEIQTQTIEIIH